MDVEENKKVLVVTDVFGFQKATLTWFLGAVRKSKTSKIRIDLGLCSQGDGVAFIAVNNPNAPITEQALKPIVIKDVFIDVKRGLCDDRLWCLNLKCPLNSAQVIHFRKYGVRNKKELETLHRLLENIKSDLKLENKEFGFIVQYEKPPVYLCAKR